MPAKPRRSAHSHGYGVVASPSNTSKSDGNPSFFLRDVPTSSNGIKLDNGPPSQIYFSEGLESYVLTGAQSREFDYQSGGVTEKLTSMTFLPGIEVLSLIGESSAFNAP